MKIGIVSDTHDTLQPAVLRLFQGVSQILHLGDVCRPTLLDELRQVAPVAAVRGNCDLGAWANALPVRDTWQFGHLFVHGLHDLAALDLRPSAQGIRLVLAGHTHRPTHVQSDGATILNPGSASTPRFGHPPTVLLLTVTEGDFTFDWYRLDNDRCYEVLPTRA
ncbi:MAG: metallophosphoesterase family protein [Planctomycetota bacterium]